MDNRTPVKAMVNLQNASNQFQKYFHSEVNKYVETLS